MVADLEETVLPRESGRWKDQSGRGPDAYVVSRITGQLSVTALGDPPRDLGSFPLAQSAAAVIVVDAAGGESAHHGALFARDFLAPLEDPNAVSSVTIRWARLESWLNTLETWRAGKVP